MSFFSRFFKRRKHVSDEYGYLCQRNREWQALEDERDKAIAERNEVLAENETLRAALAKYEPSIPLVRPGSRAERPELKPEPLPLNGLIFEVPEPEEPKDEAQAFTFVEAPHAVKKPAISNGKAFHIVIDTDGTVHEKDTPEPVEESEQNHETPTTEQAAKTAITPLHLRQNQTGVGEG